MMTDNISDMITRIRNANSAGHEEVLIPASKLKANICKVLKKEGFIKSFKITNSVDNKLNLKLKLKSDAITNLQRISKPGLRKYYGYNEIPRVLNGLGVSIISSSQGVISSRDAKKQKVGGELLFNVW